MPSYTCQLVEEKEEEELSYDEQLEEKEEFDYEEQLEEKSLSSFFSSNVSLRKIWTFKVIICIKTNFDILDGTSDSVLNVSVSNTYKSVLLESKHVIEIIPELERDYIIQIKNYERFDSKIKQCEHYKYFNRSIRISYIKLNYLTEADLHCINVYLGILTELNNSLDSRILKALFRAFVEIGLSMERQRTLRSSRNIS
ncbi:4192_t:CDS:2, partial [Funneliformis geosporum]